MKTEKDIRKENYQISKLINELFKKVKGKQKPNK